MKKILVNQKPFELKYLNLIMDGFQANHKGPENTLFLKSPSKETLFEIQDEVILTSISENNVTFLSPREIAPYTTFKIPSPLSLFITMVPLNQNLENKKGLIHYFGLVSCTNEEDKMQIRKLVNILIKLDIEDTETFKLKSVDELREDILNEESERIIRA